MANNTPMDVHNRNLVRSGCRGVTAQAELAGQRADIRTVSDLVDRALIWLLIRVGTA
ncbi:MAG TPA: hypothetical protein VGI74_27240 [Streptosporangiaceae bacterium]|jgi:hypothetical protein